MNLSDTNQANLAGDQQPKIELPATLHKQLADFQQCVWKSKMQEVFWIACVGLGIGFLSVFIIDRFIDTSRPARGLIAVIAFGLWMLIPWAFHRWVWKHRRIDQVARLLRVRSPNLGDELLGVIELAENRTEQSRSPALCAAAIEQVADRTASRDLNTLAPISHHRRWGNGAAVLGALALVLMVVIPSATWNAAKRLLAPWSRIDRYTFAQIERLPSNLVVPHGESFTLQANLTNKTRWSPSRGTAVLARNQPTESKLESNQYQFVLPSLNSNSMLDLRIGDYTHRMKIEPKLRPVLTSIRAEVRLPDYLQLPDASDRDLRGGTLSVVAGSRIFLEAIANRPLQSAQLYAQLPSLDMPIVADAKETKSNGDSTVSNSATTAKPFSVLGIKANDAEIQSEEIDILEGVSNLSMNWSDEDGLTSHTPLRISVVGLADAPPLIATEDLARQAIVLNTEQLNFRILATDDFGVKQVGLEWTEYSELNETNAAELNPIATRILANGGPDQTNFTSLGTFRAIDFGIESKAIELRLWVEDYLPGRPKSYSLPHRLLVLTPDEHAIWITEQLNKWHRQSLDVRDRELQLYQTNKELRALPSSAFEDSTTRQRLEEQAAGEASNERRLRSLTNSGEDLLRQAARNPEVGVGHLERWAEILKTLNDISSNRMPKVTDLLQQAARESKSSSASKKESGPATGIVRNLPTSLNNAAPDSEEQANEKLAKPPMPSIVDVESSQQPPPEKLPEGEGKPSNPGESKLQLPTTVLIGPPQKAEPTPEAPAQEATNAAVHEQEDLLAEFERLADEMNKILGELEGSTLVKRLKAASREQTQVAQEIGKRIQGILAASNGAVRRDTGETLNDLTEIEKRGSEKVSNIVDDLEAFYERRRDIKFRDVLKEMQDVQVVAAIRQLGDELRKEQGMSIAQAEFWSDTMDRWAEDLVDPACKGSCPGSKNSDSLPPSVVLEVLQIIEGQVNVREETRVVEQAREAAGKDEHHRASHRLSGQQEELANRVGEVVEKIAALPEGTERFAKEIGQLSEATSLMVDSVSIFEKPDTGRVSLAIQTEIVELLLQSKRINPKSGGGSGKAPGGGGKGDTTDAALALLGTGLNPKEKLEAREISQATGQSSSSLPEEFRDGLNQYFNRLEATPATRRETP
ncbi:MAG: hypothetical protein SGI77_28040 [Pirellulaceae bacterium]|nr:hypothetical protein [Pirellulaceae bacterium]